MGKRTWTILAVVAVASAGVAACFPDYEFPGDDGGTGDDTGSDSGLRPGDSGVDATPGADAGDSGLGADGPDATITDGASDATTTTPPLDSGGADAAVDSGILVDAVLLLHLDESSFVGTGAIKDSSGAGNNASLAGVASGVTPTTAGKFQGAASFNGTGWIEIPDSASLTFTNKFTLSAWVSYTAVLASNESPGIIVKRAGFGAASYTLFVWNTNNADDVWVDEQSARINSSAQVLNNGNWYHLAAVYDGTVPSVTIYVNGVMSGQTTASVTSTLAPSTLPVRIGDLPDGGNTLNGKVDEVAIWSRALSAAEIASLASATGPL